MHRFMTRRVVALTAALTLAVPIVAACNGDDGSGETKAANSEQSRQARAFNTQVAAEPAHVMTYPMTRKTINFWIDTWNKPGQLAYVYLRNTTGEPTGYFVTRGLPVSYCVGLTQGSHEVKDNDGGNYSVPNPSVDAAYYGGCDNQRYYAQDANTGKYVEWTTGNGQEMLIYSQPGPAFENVQPLGYTKIGHVNPPPAARTP